MDDEQEEWLTIPKACIIGAAAMFTALTLRYWWDKPTLPPQPLMEESPINRLGLTEEPLAGSRAWLRVEAIDRGDGQDRVRLMEQAKDRLRIELDLRDITQQGRWERE